MEFGQEKNIVNILGEFIRGKEYPYGYNACDAFLKYLNSESDSIDEDSINLFKSYNLIIDENKFGEKRATEHNYQVLMIFKKYIKRDKRTGMLIHPVKPAPQKVLRRFSV